VVEEALETNVITVNAIMFVGPSNNKVGYRAPKVYRYGPAYT